MGIHYDYKSTRGDKAMKKKLSAKLELNKEEQKSINSPKLSKESEMHDIDKPITLEDLTNQIKANFKMRSFAKKDFLLKDKEGLIKKEFK